MILLPYIGGPLHGKQKALTHEAAAALPTIEKTDAGVYHLQGCTCLISDRYWVFYYYLGPTEVPPDFSCPPCDSPESPRIGTSITR